jgi:DNA-binding GntR family transcriptional regulator
MPKLSQNNAVTSQRDQAYNGLRRLLILQQIESGQRLREPEWADRLGVHRSALREALARLDADGLVQRGTRTGYFVPSLTPDDVAEITKLRLAFECVAIDEICSAGKKAPLDRIARACDEFEQFHRGGYSLGATEADRRFHEAIIDAAGMRRLSALYSRAPLPVIHGHTEEPDVWADACRRTSGEHRQILGALKRRDAQEAKRVLRDHLMQRSILPICR